MGDDAGARLPEITDSVSNILGGESTYNSYVYWSRWYQTQPALTWVYDSGGGQIEFVENLSGPSCPVVCEKYDTHCCNVNLNLNRSYPSKALSSSAASLDEPAGGNDLGVVNAAHEGEGELDAAGAGRDYSVVTTRDGDAHLVANLGKGIGAYSRAAWGLANRTVAHGPADGVVTFARPLDWETLARVEAMGVQVHDVELVSEPDTEAMRWTFFAMNEPTAEEFVAQLASENGLVISGIVAADVTVPDAATLNRLGRADDVYLVDLSVADYERRNPGIDANQNDVYWTLQGWK